MFSRTVLASSGDCRQFCDTGDFSSCIALASICFIVSTSIIGVISQGIRCKPTVTFYNNGDSSRFPEVILSCPVEPERSGRMLRNFSCIPPKHWQENARKCTCVVRSLLIGFTLSLTDGDKRWLHPRMKDEPRLSTSFFVGSLTLLCVVVCHLKYIACFSSE